MKLLSQYLTNITTDSILGLDIGEVEESLELPVTWIISSYLLSIWEKRKAKKSVNVGETRAELEARCNLLRETRFKYEAQTISNMLENF